MNYHLFELINQRAGRADDIDDVMEFAAKWLIYAVFAAAAALLAVAGYRRRCRPVLEVGAVLALAFAGSIGLEHLSRQLRPFQTHQVHQLIAHGGGVSMPSDHATAAFARPLNPSPAPAAVTRTQPTLTVFLAFQHRCR